MTTPTGPTVDHNSYLGGSDIGAIAGQSPWRTGLDVWAEKTGKAPPFEGNIHTELGNAFERPALAVYAKAMGVELSFPGTLLHPKESWAGATPDAVENGQRLVECKIVGFNTAKHWGPPDEGADGVPYDTLCQVHWQSWIANNSGVAQCSDAVVVAFKGTSMDVYRFGIDEGLIESLVKLGRDFWDKYVIGGSMPAVEGNSAADIIKAIHPRNLTDDLLPMTEYVRATAMEYDDARENEKLAAAHKKAVQAQLTALIGDGAGFKDEDGSKATWKAGKGSPAWKKIAEQCSKHIDSALYKSIIKEHTPETGARKLHVNIK